MKAPSISRRFTRKLIVSFLLLILLIGISYSLITYFFTQRYFQESAQRLHANVAAHLIDEKFKEGQPFLADGEVNKALFGDIMHDMMAINRSLEVYLLNESGEVLYSVVLDHDKAEQPVRKVSVAPIHSFIESKGQQYILGDDPREPDQPKTFSAAPYDVDGHQGYVYIILASEVLQATQAGLLSSYFMRLGFGVSLVAMVLVAIIGTLVIWYVTSSLRKIIFAVNRFKEGDLQARIEQADQMDLSVLAQTYNEMADTIVSNIEKLQSVEQLRRELIANVSHDLRTPLSILQGYVETLQMKKEQLSPEDKERYLNIIVSSVEKLSHMIHQLFEFSKLEASQIEPEKEAFPLQELVRDIWNKYQLLADKKGIQLILKTEDQLPLVFADVRLVERVIQNLLDNALKFTQKGGLVELALTSDRSKVQIAVKDNGPGIVEDEQKLIFERFKQVGNQRQGLAGAGLGLAIVKKIIDIHQSTIDVISQPNQGTTFSFGLPVYQLGN